MKEKDLTILIAKLQSIAQNGKAYGKDPYDLERYHQLEEITAELIREATDFPAEKIALYMEADGGYATPKVDVRSAVFDEENRLLLVKEKSDQCWSLPGGWADPGHSPFEIAEKETLEEAGISVKAERLLMVKDKGKHSYPPSLLYVYKMFILCRAQTTAVKGGLETADARFFEKSELEKLELSLERNLSADLHEVFARKESGEVYCD